MQLKIRRSQRDGGVIAKTAVFCIDARVQFTGEEQRNINRYKLGSQTIYNSEASKSLLEKSNRQNDGSTRGVLKSIASLALAAMKLNISINSLARGQRIECKSLDELIAAEDALMEACENLKGYLDTAATFDGREVLFGFESGHPEVIATSATPEPMLIVEPRQAMPLGTIGEVDANSYIEAPQRFDDETTDFAASEQGFAYDAGAQFQTILTRLKTMFFQLPLPVRIIGIALVLYFGYGIIVGPVRQPM